MHPSTGKRCKCPSIGPQRPAGADNRNIDSDPVIPPVQIGHATLVNLAVAERLQYRVKYGQVV